MNYKIMSINTNETKSLKLKLDSLSEKYDKQEKSLKELQMENVRMRKEYSTKLEKAK